MATNENESRSAKEINILRQWIDDLKYMKSYKYLKDVAGFKNIVSKRGSYISFDELSGDINLLVAENENSDGQEVAKKLQEDWIAVLEEIRMCINCYCFKLKNEDYVTLVCSKPHLLVYLPDNFGRRWPAKLFGENDDEKANTQCFGDDMISNEYNFEQCLIYADTDEDLRKKTKQAENSKIKKYKTEFVSAFKDVAKYIENVKRKYANSTKPAFVPASSKKQTVTNVIEHLKEMFPAAFEQDDSMPPEDNELQAAMGNDHYEIDDNDDGSFIGTPPNSPASLGYASRGYNSDHSEVPVEAERQPPEFRIEEIKAEYQQHDDETESDIETQADLTAERETRKRKVDAGMLKQPSTKKMTKTSGKSKDVLITIDDEIDTETPSTSSQSYGFQRSAANEGNFKLLLDEHAQIAVKIALNEQKKMEHERENEGLLAQKAIIEAKLDKFVQAHTSNE